MKKISRSLLCLVACLVAGPALAQTEVTQQEAKSLYKNTTKRRVSIHDPSVVYEPVSQRYYIFGSHKAGAYTTDLQNWTQANPTWRTATKNPATNQEAFLVPQVATVQKNGEQVAMPAFNAMDWSARTDASYNIDGNMWAPDVVWNKAMQKWCMYLSINGDAWHSSIVMLTADQITGPYRYQAPVVICGFYDASHSYKDTDLELVLGTQSSLPARYNVGSKWGNRWPHTIDPAAFYDEQGQLWLVYGSWSGGIWMLQLDETTGLRDYDATYPVAGSGDAVTSDPYFGTKIAGGRYVSGEGPYIHHIGDYYYLFVSYGFYSPNGGYEMRVFRSQNPNGPYVDARGNSAIFASYAMNYGKNGDTRGEKLMGAYNQWGFQTVGECAQGHNSVITTDDGRTMLVYHTKFNDGTIGHQVRVHQLFINQDGWPVASPFEYNGEDFQSPSLPSSLSPLASHLPGTYQLLVHKYGMDYENYEEVTPVAITLTADGKVSGARSGTWAVDEGTSYITLTLSGVTYKGVVYEEIMDSRSLHTVSFSVCSKGGVNAWGYKLHPRYAVAWQLNNQTVPVSNGQQVNYNLDLDGMSSTDVNVDVQWTSTQPDVISEHGLYNPESLAADLPTTLTARVSSGDYFWQQDYSVTALSAANSQPAADWLTGLVGHYAFDEASLSNSMDASQQAQLLSNGGAARPQLLADEPLRNGQVVRTAQGAQGKNGYVSMPNPLFGQSLTDGATVSFFVKRADNNLWDALCGFQNEDQRLYATGNLYVGYNNGSGSWLDINHPDQVQPANLTVGKWHLLTLVFQRTATAATGGVTIYVDGIPKVGDRFNGALGTKNVTTKQAFDYQLLIDHIAACPQFCLGNGSFWGAPSAKFDDVVFHNRALSLVEVMALRQMMDRAHGSQQWIAGIGEVTLPTDGARSARLFDLSGRPVSHPQRGIYIQNHKKIIIP